MPRRRIDISKDRASEAGLDAGGESAEVAYALHFVVGEFDAEVIFEAAEKFEGLQAVDAELFEEVVVGRERAYRHIEVLRRKFEDLLRCLINGSHRYVKISPTRH